MVFKKADGNYYDSCDSVTPLTSVTDEEKLNAKECPIPGQGGGRRRRKSKKSKKAKKAKKSRKGRKSRKARKH